MTKMEQLKRLIDEMALGYTVTSRQPYVLAANMDAMTESAYAVARLAQEIKRDCLKRLEDES